MNLSGLKSLIKNIADAHIEIKAFQLGEDFEVATSKSSERYPVVWLELPVYINYLPNKKVFSFALDVLDLGKEDDVNENYDTISRMEVFGDQISQKLKQDKQVAIVDVVNAITLRNFSDDLLSGVRMEMEVTVNRECDIDDWFDMIT